MNLLYYKIRPEILASSGYFGFVGPNSIHAINPTIPLLVDGYKVQILTHFPPHKSTSPIKKEIRAKQITRKAHEACNRHHVFTKPSNQKTLTSNSNRFHFLIP